MKSFFRVKNKSWNLERIRLNKERMARVFVAAVHHYNQEASNKERIDRNGVHIAEQLVSPEGFRLVAGYHTDLVTNEAEVVEGDEVYRKRIQTTIYSNLVVGYDWRTMMIVIIEVNAELSAFSEVRVFSKKEVLRAKYGWFSEVFQIYDRGESLIKNILTFLNIKNRVTFMINAESNDDFVDDKGEAILVYMRQNEERADFVKFFTEFARKKS